MVLVADSDQEAEGPPAGVEAAVTVGQAGINRLVRGVVIAVDEEGQPGHGQVLVRLGNGEADRLFGQTLGAAHGPTIASLDVATTPGFEVVDNSWATLATR